MISLRLISIAALTVFVTSITALAQSNEGIGFFPATKPDFPVLVKKAAKSTFRIVAPGGQLVPLSSIVGDVPLEVAKQKFLAMTGHLGKIEQALGIYQINQCSPVRRDCRIYSEFARGTAFVTGNGYELRTARHNIQVYIDNNTDTRAGKQKIPAYVLDNNDHVILDPNSSDLNLKRSGVSHASGATDMSADDYAVLSIPIKIADPILMAKASPLPGEKIFIAGFAMPTSDRSKFYLPDSNGTTRIISSGHVLSARDMQDRQALALQAGILIADFGPTSVQSIFNSFIISTADGAPRLSGAPTLNSQGQAVGIYIGGTPADGKATPYRFSYSTRGLK